MLKRVLIVAVIGVFVYSCNNAPQQTDQADMMHPIAELVSDPLAFDNQEITCEGLITHICRHAGDKMRINSVDNPDLSVMVMLQDLQTQFSPEMEGQYVKVTGIMKTEVVNMDALGEHNHEHEGEHNHEGAEAGGHECASTEEAIQKMAEQGISPEIRAFIELKSFEIIELPENAASDEGETTEVAGTTNT